VEDVLLFAARNGLSLGRAQLKDVRRLCDDGRAVPWDREKGPGRAWVSGFLRRHPRVSERRNGVYEATEEDIEPRIEAFCKMWAAAVEEYAPAPDHLHNADETGATSQGTQTLNAIAETGAVDSIRPKMRENTTTTTTVVSTISANGHTFAPSIIFEGRRLETDWLNNGPRGARYACWTESSSMRTNAFMDYLKDFHKQLGGLDLLDGKPHILVLGDGLASRVVVSSDAIRLAMDLNIVLFQLPPHTSHVIQPLDVGNFKREVTKVLSSFRLKNGGILPRKHDVPGVIAEAWKSSFSPEQNKASFAAAGLWPVNKDRAISRLRVTAKRKARTTDCPPLEDVAIVASNQELEEYLGGTALRDLEVPGHLVVGVDASAVMVGGLLAQRKRAK
ncbi:unnamed protein product, partial [Ectocarpus sp. 6 AP-2014]